MLSWKFYLSTTSMPCSDFMNMMKGMHVLNILLYLKMMLGSQKSDLFKTIYPVLKQIIHDKFLVSFLRTIYSIVFIHVKFEIFLIFFYFQINIFIVFWNHFNGLILKINFLK